MITPGLAKPFLNLIQESERDETLFGVSLPEKIKASKTIEKQGLQIKKTVPPPRSNPIAPSTSVARQPFQGNWTGPPRYSTNRGGRGGHRKFPTPSRRPATTPLTATPTPPDTYPGCSGALRCAFSRRGVPPTALNLMIGSLSYKTLQQYGVCYMLWWKFCHDNDYNVFDTSVSHVVSFLTELFESGASYGTLNSHRSALSLFLGNNLGSDDCIKRLMKGIFRIRPSLPKYSNLRPSSTDHLLITVKRPHRGATAQSISRWIKQTLCASGIDVAVFGAHSARHAATSAARAAGLSVDVIRKTAGWTASSQTFAKFYNRPLILESNFAKTVCLPSKNNDSE
ncbi:hypothetical protein OBRU01_18711 [Operophtera brumata]|uniref:Tyr recombinase domain-containing protein n=1 Tax=Operophtera brumata TaxID=104452 RepID=A0A0L7KYP1_OPEBR|nr:hypothetical protein OBRU01_18711 [Operophtera brumata]